MKEEKTRDVLIHRGAQNVFIRIQPKYLLHLNLFIKTSLTSISYPKCTPVVNPYPSISVFRTHECHFKTKHLPWYL